MRDSLGVQPLAVPVGLCEIHAPRLLLETPQKTDTAQLHLSAREPIKLTLESNMHNHFAKETVTSNKSKTDEETLRKLMRMQESLCQSQKLN